MDSIPLATGDTPEGDVNLSMNYFEFDPNDFDVDLQDAFLADDQEQTQEPQAAAEATPETPEEQAPEGEGAEEEGAGLLVGDEELESAAEGGESLLEEDLISEIAKILDEELVVDMGETKQGHITTDEGTLKYEQEKELASEEDDEEKEKEEEYKKKIEELDEAIAKVTKQNKQFLNIINELNETLNETLLSNAKLLYSNKTLSDASLNERQKIKIVEAIAKANTPEEAKNLQEALKTTVGSTKSQGPKSLSESVQRRSNLSNVLPRRKQPDNQQFSFAEHMKKLAGIK
jgi:C4-type Zn-finger protein